jgi:hypothetical protein
LKKQQEIQLAEEKKKKIEVQNNSKMTEHE